MIPCSNSSMLSPLTETIAIRDLHVTSMPNWRWVKGASTEISVVSATAAPENVFKEVIVESRFATL